MKCNIKPTGSRSRMGEKSLKALFGPTPMIKVDGIYAKLECVHPCGSIKDRMVRYILNESESKGLLKKGMRLIEATSGNTGIALSYYAKQRGYDVTIVMPENMTEERKKLIKGMGADLILCSKEGSFAEAVAIRDDICSRNRDYFNLDQFSNPLNVECHYKTTGQEILRQIMERTFETIDAFVAGVGTGGSLIGVAQALKAKYPNVHIAAVEPSESAVMTGGKPAAHGIPGIGDGFVPVIARGRDRHIHELINEIITISSERARDTAQRIYEDYGYCVGISSGANYLVAKKLSSKFRTVVTIFPDGFSLYGSLGLRRNQNGRCPYEKRRVNVLSNRRRTCLTF